MSNLIERLRADVPSYSHQYDIFFEAADEIERLRELVDAEQGLAKGIKERNAYLEQEVKRLRAELRLRKDEYVERQEWAAEQAMAVIKEKDAEIERLHKEHDCILDDMDDLRESLRLHDKAAELSKAENERLRAELETLAEGNVERWERECAYAAEIERLKAMIVDYEYIGELEREVQRLRAALEEIISDNGIGREAEIAREAL